MVPSLLSAWVQSTKEEVTAADESHLGNLKASGWRIFSFTGHALDKVVTCD